MKIKFKVDLWDIIDTDKLTSMVDEKVGHSVYEIDYDDTKIPETVEIIANYEEE